jgi:hypothetical protein
MSRLDFGSAALGEVPDNASVSALCVAGKNASLKGAEIAALTFGQWAAGEPATPINLLVTMGKENVRGLAVSEFSPGGRARDEIAPGLLAGKKPFQPKEDMYGVITPIK